MKRLLFVLLALTITILLVGCGDIIDNADSSKSGEIADSASSVLGDKSVGGSLVDGDSADSEGGADATSGSCAASDIASPDNPDVDDEKEGYKFSLSLDEGAELGLLNGVITLEPRDKEFQLYFGNDDGKLKGYTKIGEGKGDFTLDKVVVPPEATRLIISIDGEEYFEKIPEECLLFGKDAFVFGVLSDIHYNKYYSDGENDDAIYSFDNALDYFDEIGVQMVGVTGDLSNDGEESALVYYNEAISGRSYPVFTVVGNHDMPAYTSGLWTKHISEKIENCEFAENGTDYIYKPQGEDGDVFIFFNLTRWSYSNKRATVVAPAQLDWLEEKLELYKDRRVYLFFHLFLCGPDGEKHTGVGNIMNPGGYTYPLPYNYANYDERTFRILMRDYKNVVYFSGHSHWMFEMEIYGDWLNYSNYDGTYCHMVHVPSVTEPRWIGENDTDRTGKHGESSQGIVMYDYGDISVLVPIDFITGTIFTEYMEIIK